MSDRSEPLPLEQESVAVAAALRSFATTLARALGPTAPRFEQLRDILDGATAAGQWLSLVAGDQRRFGDLIDHVYEHYRLYPFPMAVRTVPAATAMAFLETVAAVRGGEQVLVITDGYHPVPLFQIGPAFVIGHFDPAYQFDSFLPSELTIPVWLSMGDYREMRTDLRNQLQLAGSQAYFQAPVRTPPMTFEAFLSQRKLHLDPDTPFTRLREFLQWTRTLPNLAASEEQALSALVIRDADLRLEELTTDLQLFARRTLTAQHVLRTDTLAINHELRALLDPDLVTDHQLCPLWITDRYCFLITDKPVNNVLLDDFQNRAQRTAVAIVVPSHQYHAACTVDPGLATIYTTDRDDTRDADQPKFTIEPSKFNLQKPAELVNNGSDDPQALLEFILPAGVTARAADLHFEVVDNCFRIRKTTDGVTSDFMLLPVALKGPLCSRIKQQAEISLESKDQNSGRFLFGFGNRRVDCRVQALFDAQGHPRIAIRLLDKMQPISSVASLGLTAQEITMLSDVYHASDGLLWVCGSTGEGKSTTLFAILNELNRPSKVLYSLEDPPEYLIAGVTQIHCTSDPTTVRAGRPLFSTAIQSLLRMAPNVVSVGEVRNALTANNFLDIGLSGHLGLCSFHARDVFTAVLRLLSFKLNPVDLVTCTRMIVCQRLVRRVCRCHTLEPITDSERKFFADSDVSIPASITKLPVAQGCATCGNTGYRGRLAVMEMLRFNDELAGLIVAVAPGSSEQSASLARLREVAIASGYRSVLQTSLAKVLLGQTTMAEVDRHIRRTTRTQRLNSSALAVSRAA